MLRIVSRTLLVALASITVITAVAAQKKAEPPAAPDPSLADLTSFQSWLDDYRVGRIRMMHELQIDQAALDQASALMAKLAAWNSQPALQKLFEAAMVDPRAPGERSSTDNIDFRAELQPWRIRAIARGHIAQMTLPGLDGWLIGKIESKKLRDADENGDADRRAADAALQVLGARKNVAAQMALLQATSRMPPKLRLRALDVLADSGEMSLTDTFVKMVGDADPDVRIAAANALGGALREHTDETRDREVSAETVAYRDRAIEALERLLVRDKVWQVRAAACHALAQLRCKAAIPALIDGYAAELDRKKDPWAMDMRIHGVLEQLTGQSVAIGNAQHWRDFWKREGASMRLVTPEEAEKRRAAGKDDRYEKFFALRIESDRVLFVVDFSGSMDEPITLETGTTSTGAGTKTTKARLVVDEMKKIVTSLPDGSYFNIVVFSDEVRVWRPTREGYPELVRLDDNTRDELLGSFLDNLAPRGPTNLHDALELAIGFAGRGLTDKHYALGFDTVYVLSDGAPSYGKVTDKDEIRRRVRESNRLKRLTIHSVTFGDRNDTDFLRLLAEENGGRHVHVD
ncbi:MAG: HEAT repeat domain-containing protein [Planctomycetota bacterium]